MSTRTYPVSACAVLVFLLAVPVSGQTVWRVDGAATGPGHDGASWCGAFQTLDEALGVAGPGDVIRVADGGYAPNPTGLANPRDATFTLVTGVTIEGGYAGCGAADPDNRDVVAFATILTGDVSGNDPADEWFYQGCCNHTFAPGCPDQSCAGVVCAVQPQCCTLSWQSVCVTLAESLCGSLCATKDDNSYSVVSAIDVSVTLDGVTIERGEANSGALLLDDTTLGGGVFASGGSLTLANCLIRDNHANVLGGGIRMDGGSLSLTDCTFDNNLATAFNAEGGGLGGGFYMENGDVGVSACRFTDNLSGDGGAIRIVSGGGSIESSLFTGNWFDAISLHQSSPAIRDCDLLGNGAGFVLNSFSSPTITNCRIIGNLGTGLKCGAVSEPVMTNCIVANNISGGTGGGVSCGSSCALQIINTAIVQNFAFGKGGGVYVTSSATSKIVNSLVWGNSADTEGQQIFLRPSTNFPSSVEVVTTILEGGMASVEGDGTVVWGVGNIDADPNFMDPDGRDDVPGTLDDDYRLGASSPAIDAGDNALVPVGVTTDLVGNARVHDGDGDGVATVDMGPLEVVVPIPAVSAWGLIVFSLSLAATGTVLVRRRGGGTLSTEVHHDTRANETCKGGVFCFLTLSVAPGETALGQTVRSGALQAVYRPRLFTSWGHRRRRALGYDPR